MPTPTEIGKSVYAEKYMNNIYVAFVGMWFVSRTFFHKCFHRCPRLFYRYTVRMKHMLEKATKRDRSNQKHEGQIHCVYQVSLLTNSQEQWEGPITGTNIGLSTVPLSAPASFRLQEAWKAGISLCALIVHVPVFHVSPSCLLVLRSSLGDRWATAAATDCSYVYVHLWRNIYASFSS